MPPQFFKKKAAGLTAMGAIEALVRFPLTRAFSPWRSRPVPLRIGAGLGLTRCSRLPLFSSAPILGFAGQPRGTAPRIAAPLLCALASVI